MFSVAAEIFREAHNFLCSHNYSRPTIMTWMLNQKSTNGMSSSSNSVFCCKGTGPHELLAYLHKKHEFLRLLPTLNFTMSNKLRNSSSFCNKHYLIQHLRCAKSLSTIHTHLSSFLSRDSSDKRKKSHLKPFIMWSVHPWNWKHLQSSKWKLQFSVLFIVMYIGNDLKLISSLLAIQ